MRVSNFIKGASPQGSRVVAAIPQKITTALVSLPKTKYGQGGGRRKRSKKR